jgi:hypothetical protein
MGVPAVTIAERRPSAVELGEAIAAAAAAAIVDAGVIVRDRESVRLGLPPAPSIQLARAGFHRMTLSERLAGPDGWLRR